MMKFSKSKNATIPLAFIACLCILFAAAGCLPGVLPAAESFKIQLYGRRNAGEEIQIQVQDREIEVALSGPADFPGICQSEKRGIQHISFSGQCP